MVATARGDGRVMTLPSVIDPTKLRQTFDERWTTLDAGADQVKPKVPHRWRTVYGYGGPTSFDNRKGSETSVFVDRDFGGVENGKLGTVPLGLDPFKVNPGAYLAIIAKRTPEVLKPKLFNAPYMSGSLNTKFSFSQLFGYFEMRAKLPFGKGMWPAWWLMPITGQWPTNGELDIFEGLGVSNEIWCSVHTSEEPKHRSEKIVLPFDVSKDWHTYGAAWSADEIVWYVDRKEVRRVKTPADMRTVPMYLILNLAVGGSWGGYPDANAPFPVNFYVNRVSAWAI